MATDTTVDRVNRARRLVEQLLEASVFSLGKDYVLAALTLAHVAIDTMAWLGRPSGEPQVTRGLFVDWVDSYLLPSDLGCSALEIYGSRCGLLHSQAPGSRQSEQGRARGLWWFHGRMPVEPLQVLARRRSDRSVPVKVEEFIRAVITAGNRFFDAVDADESLAALVAERSRRQFRFFPNPEGL